MFPKQIRQVGRRFARHLPIGLGLLLVALGVNALPPGTEDEIRERLVAAGQLCRSGDDCGVVVAAGPVTPRTGEEVYTQYCFACHSTGVSGAPVLGDIAAWQPRMDKGMDSLLETMRNGVNAMPPMGTCMNCSDEELQASLEHMASSGQ